MTQAGAPPSVTVIVCTRDRREELEVCLEALAGQTCAVFQTLVVDNGASPGVADLCLRWGARYVRESEPGLCFARNTGVRHADSELVAFIDDDAVPDGAWLATLTTAFADPSIAAATGTITYVSTAHGARGITAADATPASVRRLPEVFDRRSNGWFAQACFGGIGDGSNMAFRRQALLESPGFDNRLGRGRVLDGGDESVVFMTLLALGHRIAHVPDAVIRHPAPADPQALRARLFRERRNAVAYVLFLWTDFPANRRDLTRHLLGAAVRRLWWRCAPVQGAGRLSVWRSLHAALAGLSLFAEARREWNTIPAPDYRGIGLPAHRRKEMTA